MLLEVYIARMDDDYRGAPWRLMVTNDFLDVNTYYAFVSDRVNGHRKVWDCEFGF